MGYSNPDIYYNPEKFGLEIVGELEFLGGYEFDTFVVYREVDTGRLGYAEDYGCSCKSPFEDFKAEDITFAERWGIIEEARKEFNSRSEFYRECTEIDLVNLIDKVVNA
ncbi:hypothetical protein [Actinomadura sp. WMMB 499]|uniref:DUF7574 domain-containing protein n=1 Tax=Actinomadura sp. WMMB 499 TaxID=1219491 RepID=UPI001247B4A5|nr:hypothetical protein [Actinomadura sp. WMMB 499]QFG25469.1 hypothetical protein F7P10_34325 [Actinomadura sp. WMMB 499]